MFIRRMDLGWGGKTGNTPKQVPEDEQISFRDYIPSKEGHRKSLVYFGAIPITENPLNFPANRYGGCNSFGNRDCAIKYSYAGEDGRILDLDKLVYVVEILEIHDHGRNSFELTNGEKETLTELCFEVEGEHDIHHLLSEEFKKADIQLFLTISSSIANEEFGYDIAGRGFYPIDHQEKIEEIIHKLHEKYGTTLILAGESIV